MNVFNLFVKALVPVLIVLIFIFSPLGRTAQPAVADAADAQAAASGAKNGFTRYDLGKGRVLFVNNQMAFESYDNWIIDPSSFEFKKRQRALSKRDKHRLQDLLVEARKEQTESYGGQVVKLSSPCTLTQRLHLKNLRLRNSDVGGSQVNFVKSYGETTIVAEIKESETDKLVFAYMEKISLGGGVSGSNGPQLSRLGKAIKMVMGNAHSVLVDVLPMKKERIPQRAEFGCKGQLGSNALTLRAGRSNSSVD
ncbi:MAG: DUF3313 family protein [Pseudomonadales bacterium]|nr:DUF3313 family protein [Pseudomonadales bacterium]